MNEYLQDLDAAVAVILLVAFGASGLLVMLIRHPSPRGRAHLAMVIGLGVALAAIFVSCGGPPPTASSSRPYICTNGWTLYTVDAREDPALCGGPIQGQCTPERTYYEHRCFAQSQYGRLRDREWTYGGSAPAGALYQAAFDDCVEWIHSLPADLPPPGASPEGTTE